MKFLRILKWLTDIKPRYTLSLDNKIYNEQKRSIDYRFKTFGEPTFPVFSYQDITSYKQILFSINPHDLVDIAHTEREQSERKKMYHISECIRNNNYRIKNFYSEKVLSGKEICNTPTLIDQLHSLDIYKIAYNTGFLDGRKLSQQLVSEPEGIIEGKQNGKLKLVHNAPDI
ncbi:MAG: hypothetical protein H0U73_08280 [Tatlockia sp.]|nr:hypothetical protein [Tatlockia sp.]